MFINAAAILPLGGAHAQDANIINAQYAPQTLSIDNQSYRLDLNAQKGPWTWGSIEALVGDAFSGAPITSGFGDVSQIGNSLREARDFHHNNYTASMSELAHSLVKQGSWQVIAQGVQDPSVVPLMLDRFEEKPHDLQVYQLVGRLGHWFQNNQDWRKNLELHNGELPHNANPIDSAMFEGVAQHYQRFQAVISLGHLIARSPEYQQFLQNQAKNPDLIDPSP